MWKAQRLAFTTWQFAVSASRSWKGNQWIWVTRGWMKETVGLTRILLPDAGAQGSGLGTLLIRASPSLLSFLLPFLPLLRSHRCQGALGQTRVTTVQGFVS